VPRDPRPIAAIARAVVDGTAVDWSEAAAHAAPDDRRLVEQMQLVAGISHLHRTRSTPAAGDRLGGTSADPPATWGPLRVFECIGRGASGQVYRAWDARLDREVALKLVPATGSGATSDAFSVIHEGRLLARVRHPNVVTVYGAEQVGDRVGLWMELVQGRTLGDLVREGHAFTPAEAVQIGLAIAGAVAAVHAAGLLHRDIKAQNVMRADDGRVVLMDFGTGREMRDPSSDLAGTPLFLAPEVLMGEPATPQSDVYSVGVVLYHLVTGSYPVLAATAAEVRAAHAAGVWQKVRAQRPGLPIALSAVIDRALEPRPDRRYPSAGDLLVALRELAEPASVANTSRVFLASLLVVVAALVWQVWPGRPWGPGPVVIAASPWDQPAAVAVLPFAYLGSSGEGELVAAGLTAEIVRSLAAIDGLSIRPLLSSANVTGAPSAATIGRQVEATFVLSGSVLATNGRLRVQAQLTRVADGVAVWADAIVRDGTDVFSAHEAISTAIVNRLRLRVGRGQRRYQIDPDLYYQFLRGRGLQVRRHVENAGRAAALFEQVIARDRSFAPAWAGLASALGAFSRAVPGDVLPPRNPVMETAAMEAIRLDPLLADAHAALGALYAQDREWARADESFREALALNPSLTAVHTDYVLAVLLPMGRLEEASRLLEAASSIEPLSLDVRRIRALIEIESGRYREAMESARWVLDRDPGFPFADLWLGRALLFLGRPDEAIPIFQRAPDRFGYLGYLYAVNGRRRDAEALAEAHPDLPARQMLIYAGLGDADRALDALERTLDINWWMAATWIQRPEVALLRGHPRLLAVKRRLGLPE
jgi:TolB-like protein/tetratricopeptide (TPR) repeat protein